MEADVRMLRRHKQQFVSQTVTVVAAIVLLGTEMGVAVWCTALDGEPKAVHGTPASVLGGAAALAGETWPGETCPGGGTLGTSAARQRQSTFSPHRMACPFIRMLQKVIYG